MRKLAWMGLVAVMCTTGIVGSLFGAAPTVTVTAFNAGSGAYTLSVGARDAKTYVYAAAAVEDKGETTAGWEVVKKLGVCEVGAEAVTLEGVLPRNMTMTSMKVRFFAANFPGTRVECLTSSSGGSDKSSYIDTGIVPDYNIDLTIDTKHDTSSASFGNLKVFYLFGNGANGMNYGFFGNQSSTTDGGNDGQRHTLRICLEGAYMDGDFLVGPLNSKSLNAGGLTATLFARRQAAGTIGKGGKVTI